MTVIGAHWDTVPGSPGVGDNGSGLAALLEVTLNIILISLISLIRYRMDIKTLLSYLNSSYLGCPP